MCGNFCFVMLRLLPLWMWLYILVSVFTVWHIGYNTMALTSKPILSWPASLATQAGGFVILAFECFFLGLFLLSAGRCWFFAVWHAPFWRPFGPQIPVSRRIAAFVSFVLSPNAGPVSGRVGETTAPFAAPPRFQQAEKSTVAAQLGTEEDSKIIVATGLRPNYCFREGTWAKCGNAAEGRRDRMYHAHFPMAFDYGNCCLPVWDHWCPWILVPVYLHTIKPYILALWYLTLYSAFVTLVIIWNSTRRIPSLTVIAGMPLAFISFIAFLFLSGNWGLSQLIRLAMENSTMYERAPGRDVSLRVFAFPTRDGRWIMYRSPVNPWDQGRWRLNFVHVMGDHWWQWINPFSVPRRVTQYDDENCPDFDEQFGPDFLEWLKARQPNLDDQHLPRRPTRAHRRPARRTEGRSTGVDV